LSYEEPTNEQLANFAIVVTLGASGMVNPTVRRQAADMIEASPTMRAIWLERHRQFQEKADQLGEELGSE
jgi:hypothetical protein